MASGPTTSSSEELRETVDRMGREIDVLQRKLGELHGTDVNALRRAYRSLSQHVEALEQESAGMVEQLQEFETAVLPPELVAKELGVAAAVAVGVTVLAQTARALPVKASTGVAMAKGLWIIGGAVVLFRLSAGALAHVALMLDRNARRKKRLLRKLEAVQERVKIMAELQQWADKQVAPAAAGGSEAAGPVPAEAEGEGEGVIVSPPPRASPPESAAGSEGELVEYPAAEEPAATGQEAPRASDPPAAGSGSGTSSGAGSSRPQSQQGQGQAQRQGQAEFQVEMEPLRAWSRYAKLGERGGQQ